MKRKIPRKAPLELNHQNKFQLRNEVFQRPQVTTFPSYSCFSSLETGDPFTSEEPVFSNEVNENNRSTTFIKEFPWNRKKIYYSHIKPLKINQIHFACHLLNEITRVLKPNLRLNFNSFDRSFRTARIDLGQSPLWKNKTACRSFRRSVY